MHGIWVDANIQIKIHTYIFPSFTNALAKKKCPVRDTIVTTQSYEHILYRASGIQASALNVLDGFHR